MELKGMVHQMVHLVQGPLLILNGIESDSISLTGLKNKP